MNFLKPSRSAPSRRSSRRPRSAGLEVAQLEGRALLSGVPSVATGVAVAWNNGTIDVHVAGTVSDPGATLSPMVGFQIVSSTGRLVAAGGAPLAVSGSNGSYDFWLGLTPSQVSTAGGQTYSIFVGGADMQGNIGLGASLVPPVTPPPGIYFPAAAPTTTPANVPPEFTHPPGYVDYTHGIVYN
jgi:hypothetical protein